MVAGYGISNKMLIGMGVGFVAAGGAGYLVYRYMQRDPMPEKWKRVGTLQRVNVFPLKSCAPLAVGSDEEFECDVLSVGVGNVRDRKFMLLNDKNKMITARAYPHMLKIKPSRIPNGLVFSAPGMPDLELEFKDLETATKYVHTNVWGVAVDGLLCGSRFDEWFSKFIFKKDSGLKLVYFPYKVPVRATTPGLKHMPFIRQVDSGTFTDTTSYMLMNLASVDDLNTRLKNPVEPLQFRGNFEVKMDVNEAYAEDHWQWIRIGDETVFRVVAPCTRCIFPNINVHTAERDADKEPLKTLRSYRLFGEPHPAMGIHLGVRQTGSVKFNDVVYVEDK